MKLDYRAWARFCLRFYFGAFLAGFTRHLPLVLILVAIGAAVFGGMGCEFGVPLLFWHEIWWKQGIAGVSVAILVSKVLFVGYLLDTRRPMAARNWRLSIPEDHRDFSQADAAEGQKFPLAEAGSFMIGGLFSVIVSGMIAAIVFLIFSHFAPSSCDEQPGCLTYVFSTHNLLRNLCLPLGLILGFAFAFWFLKMAFDLIDMTPRWLVRLVKGVENQEERKLHILSGGLTVLLLITYFATPLANYFLDQRRNTRILEFATPAFGLCVLAGLFAAAYGALAFNVPGNRSGKSPFIASNGTFLVLLSLVLMCFGGASRYKMRFNHMAAYYDAGHRVSIADYCPGAPAPLIRSEDVHFAPRGKRKKLAIVCVTGGGIRAAVWTGAVLRQMERDLAPDFPYHIRLITGASGGMVGSAYYVSSLRNPADAHQSGRFHDIPDSPESGWKGSGDDLLIHNLSEDTLSEPVKRMIYEDLPGMVWYPDHVDRGRAMEREWGRYLGNLDKKAFYSPQGRDEEREGWRPSLVFSPMMVEDGRRLLISNLDLEFMTTSAGPSLAAKDASPVTYSRSAYEFARLFPKAMDQFSIATAVRMSASFPYVCPASELPTEPRRRIVDAGYYDNYGVSVASAWLHHMATQHADWLKENASGVIVIQIRDGVSELDGDTCHTCQSSPTTFFGRGFEWLTSPPTAFLSARDSVSLFRNDTMLERLGQTFDDLKDKFPPGYFTTAKFEYTGGAALTWYISDAETRDIMKHARFLGLSRNDSDKAAQPQRGKFGPVDESNRSQMESLKKWWGE